MGIILKEETFEKYGYDINELKPNSQKLVMWMCSDCKIIVDKFYRYAIKFDRCVGCSNKKIANDSIEKRSESMKKWYLTNEHPLKGTKRPEHVREAMLKAHVGVKLSDETKKKISIANIGSNNGFYGKKHSDETKKRLTEIHKNIARKGKDSNFYGKCYHGRGSWYITTSGDKVWMRSSWEFKYSKYLDSEKIKWEYEPKVFDLIIDEIECSYRPDFYLPEFDVWVEVKGYWRDNAKVKFYAFLEQYPNLNVKLLMKKELKELGVL